MEKLEERITHLITQQSINDGVVNSLASEVKDIAVEFAGYIKYWTWSPSDDKYVIETRTDIKKRTSEELFDQFLNERYK